MRRNLLFPVTTYPDPTADEAIESGVNFAARHASDLTGLIAGIEIPHVSNPWSLPLIDMPRMVKEAENSSRQNGERLGGVLERLASERSVTLDVTRLRVEPAAVADKVVEQGRLHDLIVAQSGEDQRALNEAVIFGCGRPVMLVPPATWNGSVDHVAIAWDGGRAAARALGDALWLVERAARVTILFSGGDKAASTPAAKQLAASLVRRGVQADLRPVDTADRGIGDALQAGAVAAGADLLVMGGYGHSRLREFVLGGATAAVLSRPQLPVLISH
ncbi:MAG: universal stress protein [Rhizobium sp.]|nr:universal stress protein [Rhizobium sp.]